VVTALTSYGDRIGAAFQISDDLLDITSPSGESGKTPGTDLREGIRTLPVLLAEQDGLVLPDDLSDDAVLASALQSLRGSAAIERAREELIAEAAAARAQLDGLPDVAARGALEILCDYVVTRTG
jgi:heptaprenyl diphosphate synthase